MSRVIWVIHAACPSRCAYCAIETQQSKPVLPRADGVRIAEEIVALGFDQVILVGGEPLLYPHLAAVLEVLAGQVEVALFTGGIPGDLQRTLGKLARGVDRVVLFVDAGTDAENDLVRGRKGITRDVLALATALKKAHPHVGLSVNTVVSVANVKVIGGVWDRLGPLGLDSWSLTLAGDNFGESPRPSFIPRADLEVLYTRTLPELARRLTGRCELVVLPIPLPFLEGGIPPTRWDEAAADHRDALSAELDRFAFGDHNASFVARYGCPLAGRDVSIGVEGEVYPCSQAPILSPAYVMGDARRGLGQVIAGDAMRAFATSVPHAPCTRCWAPSNVDRPQLAALLGRGVR